MSGHAEGCVCWACKANRDGDHYEAVHKKLVIERMAGHFVDCACPECEALGNHPRPTTRAADLARICQELAKLLPEKNRAYGDSFSKCGEFLKLLYPKGLTPEQYNDALLLVRIFDKQVRIATDKEYAGESPYRDIAGYGVLGASVDEERRAKGKKP